MIEEPVEVAIHALALADLDRDGGLDLVAAQTHQGKSPQEVVVFLTPAAGSSGRARSGHTPEPSPVAWTT